MYQIILNRNICSFLREVIVKDKNIFIKKSTVLKMQMDDRQRIARDLHDTSLQNLIHLIHKIELSSLYIDKDPVRAKLELASVQNDLKEIINEIRNTIFDLRPMNFDDFGLASALERLLEKINEEKKYIIDSEIEEVSCENNLILLAIYRVVQECFSNIVKHADAEKIIFRCKCVDSICKIEIEDDGKGFTLAESESWEDQHFGIEGMKERIALLDAKIDFDSIKDRGTRICMEIPLGIISEDNER